MEFFTKAVKSEDGTTIGYRQTGVGEGLIICHGGGRISQNYEKLALALADEFTVYIPDRRGRGLSGAEGTDYNRQKAVQDMETVMNETKAKLVFGHSAGALISLETSLKYPIQKLALYEPPISVNNSLPSNWLQDFEKALAKNQRKKAMAISLKGLQMNDAIVKMPFWCVMLLVNLLSLAERKKQRGTSMLELLHTLPADMKMALALDSQYERYKTCRIPVLLMTGANSAAYFHQGINALEKVLPDSKTKMFEGFDHYSAEEKVTEISEALKNFFRN